MKKLNDFLVICGFMIVVVTVANYSFAVASILLGVGLIFAGAAREEDGTKGGKQQ